MFSYLRPHRRTPSNPTSPVPENLQTLHSWEPPLHPSPDHTTSPLSQDGIPPERSAMVLPPPPLSQFANVSSPTNEISLEYSIETSRTRQYEQSPRTQPRDPLTDSTRQRDIPTFSNHQRIPYTGTKRPDSAGNLGPTQFAGSQYTRPQTGGSQERTSKQKAPESNFPFVTAADIQNKPIVTGRRPTGTRLPTPPPAPQTTPSTFEPVQPRSGKTRLNLLNPMSLLARRRTSQAVTPLAPIGTGSNYTGSISSSNFDPRIRGTVVHDFSAPRPRRNVSYHDVQGSEHQSTLRPYQRSPSGQYGDLATHDESPASPWSGGSHTPVFTENFEEEQYPAAGPHVRKASDLSDLPLPKPPYAKGAQASLDPGSASRNSQPLQKSPQPAGNLGVTEKVLDTAPSVPRKAESDLHMAAKHISADPSSTPPKTSPSSKKRQSRNLSEVSTKDAIISGLPKHMKSTSSRFSFDMLGAAEQEKLLEDRHREKALRKKNASPEGDEDGLLDDEEEFDFDQMMDDDGLEERIPGINADADEDDGYNDFEEEIPGINVDADEEEGYNELEEEIPGINAPADEGPGILDDSDNVAGFTFQQQSMSSLTSPMSPYTPGMASTPRDANGEVIGFALTKESPYQPQRTSQQSNTTPGSSASLEIGDPHEKTLGMAFGNREIYGLGLQGVDVGHTGDDEVVKPDILQFETREFPQVSGIDDDDLYFDDGIIDLPGDGADPLEFDESVFDNIDTDEYGRPLKTFSTLPTLYSPPSLTPDPLPTNKIEISSKTTAVEATNTIDSTLLPEKTPPQHSVVPQLSISEESVSPTTIAPKISPGLTQDTLAAYQSALAAAAHNAAANGKFRRSSIPRSASEQEDAHPGLIADSSEFSGYEPFSPSYDDFDYDDALEDDAIIAAANAEALANDMDGFYGQEFGFYSAPAAGDAQYANGGYFGPRGGETVNRNLSGRIPLMEPNLTPITERSEYSNRNSFMSLQLHGAIPPGSLASPGLAQLMLGSDYDPDMSLNALLKLRRGAWGGSQASLHSSTGSPRSAGGEETSSPVGRDSVSQLTPWTQTVGGTLSSPIAPVIVSSGGGGGGYHRRQNSTFSLKSEAASETGQGQGKTAASGITSENSSAPASPTLSLASPVEGQGQGLKKHRHTGSADSISYSKEDDPVEGGGKKRWVLERRRRTAETGGGEVEEVLLGREVVSSGRI